MGVAYATLSDQVSTYDSSRNQGPSYALASFQLSSLVSGTIVSALDIATGNYINYQWNGSSFTEVGRGVQPTNSGNPYGIRPTGGGSGGGPLGPGWGNVPVCRGECEDGEVIVHPPQPV
jgi:hypothetical protein